MPNYSKSDIRYTIRDEDFKKMVNRTSGIEHKAFLAILYCTGARPSEISGDNIRGLKGMTVGDIRFWERDVSFFVPVSKIRQHIYSVEKRQLTLEFDPGKIDYAIEIIIKFLEHKIKESQRESKNENVDFDKPLFDFSRKTGYNIVSRASQYIGKEICPYNFRHSRLTQLSEQGAGLETLMYFKGSKNIRSIQTYLHARNIKYKLNKDEPRQTISTYFTCQKEECIQYGILSVIASGKLKVRRRE